MHLEKILVVLTGGERKLLIQPSRLEERGERDRNKRRNKRG
jgi:hypothetical protein